MQRKWFTPDYRIKEKQILRGFERYLRDDKEQFQLSIRDALPQDINNWDDYVWIDVDSFPDDIERRRESKKQSVDRLVKIFLQWRKDNTSFDQNKHTELSDAARTYFELYFQMQQRLASGDVIELLEYSYCCLNLIHQRFGTTNEATSLCIGNDIFRFGNVSVNDGWIKNSISKRTIRNS